MADKKDEKPAAKAAAKPSKKSSPINEAGWNAFGAVLLAGFGMIVTAMGGASFFEPGLATALTLVGGLVIFALSALFAKMAVSELGHAFNDSIRAAAASKAPDSDDR